MRPCATLLYTTLEYSTLGFKCPYVRSVLTKQPTEEEEEEENDDDDDDDDGKLVTPVTPNHAGSMTGAYIPILCEGG